MPYRRSAWIGKAYSKDLRHRFVTLLDEGLSASSAGRQLLVTRSTAIRWAAIWRKEHRCEALPMGGDRRSAAIEEHAGAILSWIEEQPDLFLHEIAAKLEEEQGFQSSPDAISNLLARHGVTRKKRPSSPANAIGKTSLRPAPNGMKA